MTAHDAAERHTWLAAASFRFKSAWLILKRSLQNSKAGAPKYKPAYALQHAPLLASSESLLWNANDNDSNRILTAGKIQNLRIAARALHGIEVPAGGTFSFWAQVGRPSAVKGYVAGREIREGCLLPTIAGGICQLSNALYDAALKAGFGIEERHRHSRIISGSLAEQDRDATVKWNYIDLRFRAACDFRIEVSLDADKLVVKLKGTTTATRHQYPAPLKQGSLLNDCFSCGNTACAKHPSVIPQLPQAGFTTFVLDEKWPEYEAWIGKQAKSKDVFVLPAKPGTPILSRHGNWKLNAQNLILAVPLAACRRMLSRRLAGKNVNAFSLGLQLDAQLARSMGKRIPYASNHLVVSQNLVPFLWQQGHLGGRTFDVLMTRMPMESLHKALDEARKLHRQSTTLADFRAAQTLIDAENEALTQARRIITPHRGIAALFNNKSELLDWWMPAQQQEFHTANKQHVLFPASALARKGAYEMRRLAKALDLQVMLAGKASEEPGFWEGVAISQAQEDPLRDVRLVIYPAFVEHAPRLLLRAAARGIPVIATSACGLSPHPNIHIVKPGDYEALERMTLQLLSKT